MNVYLGLEAFNQILKTAFKFSIGAIIAYGIEAVWSDWYKSNKE